LVLFQPFEHTVIFFEGTTSVLKMLSHPNQPTNFLYECEVDSTYAF